MIMYTKIKFNTDLDVKDSTNEKSVTTDYLILSHAHVYTRTNHNRREWVWKTWNILREMLNIKTADFLDVF